MAKKLSDGERDILAEMRADEIDAVLDTKYEEMRQALEQLLEWAEWQLSEQYELPGEVPELCRARKALGLQPYRSDPAALE